MYIYTLLLLLYHCLFIQKLHPSECENNFLQYKFFCALSDCDLNHFKLKYAAHFAFYTVCTLIMITSSIYHTAVSHKI